MPKWLSLIVQAGLPDQLVQHRRRAGRELPVRDDGRQQPRRAGAGRRRRLHHAVELPAPPDRRQGRLRHGRRLHRRAEAERGRAARRLHPRRGHPRRRPARRRVQPGHRHRRRGRRGHLRAPRASTWCRSPAPPGPARRVAAAASGTLKRVALELGGKSANILLDDLDDEGFEKAVRDGVGKAYLNSGPDLHRAHPHARARGAAWPTPSASPPTRSRRSSSRPTPSPTSPCSARCRARPRSTGSTATSRRASTRAPSSSPAAPASPRASTQTATSCSPRCSPRSRNDMTIAQEEIFGPVLSIIPYDDEDDAVAIANDSPYGLSGGVLVGRRRAGQGRRPADPHRPDRGQRRRLQPATPRSVATSSPATAASTASTASRSSSRSSPCSCSEPIEVRSDERSSHARFGLSRVGACPPTPSRRRHRSRRPDRLLACCSASPSGRCSGPTSRSILQLLEITPALDALRGRGDGARGLRVPAPGRHRADRRRRRRVRRRRRRPARRAPCPARTGMERADLLSANGGIFKPQGEALSRVGQARREGARRRQPGQHQLPHRPAERQGPRPRPVHGDDPARPQPGHRPARGQGRRRTARRHQDDDLGQPLGHAVPRRVPRRGRRQARLRRGRPATRRGSRATSSPPCSSAARRSSRPAACRRRRRPPTPPSTTSAPGRSAPPTATGCRWAIPSDGSYGVPEGIITQLPVHLHRTAATRSSRASTSTTSAGPASTRAPASSPTSATPSRSSASSELMLAPVAGALRRWARLRKCLRGSAEPPGSGLHPATSGTCSSCCRRGPCRGSGRWGSRRPCSGRTRPSGSSSPHTGQASPTRWCTLPGRSADDAHLGEAALEREPLGDAHLDGLDERARRRRRSSFAVVANGDRWARWQISLARRRPRPAMRCWSRRKPCSRVDLDVEQAAQRGGVDGVGVGAEARRAAAAPPGRRRRTHTPALRSVPASVSSSARPSANRQRAWPPRGLADCFSSGLQPPALHEVDDEGGRAEVEQQVLAPAADEHERLAVGRVGPGHGGLQRGEGDRGEALERGAGEVARRAARRGPGPRGAQARSPHHAVAARAGEHVVEARPGPGRPRAAAARSPPTRRRRPGTRPGRTARRGRWRRPWPGPG